MKSITDILQRLQQEKTYLQSRFHVAELSVFGSVSRGEAQATSDVDILVSFEQPIGLDFVDLADYLESVLGEKVDLVAKTAILPHYWQVIEPEVRYV